MVAAHEERRRARSTMSDEWERKLAAPTNADAQDVLRCEWFPLPGASRPLAKPTLLDRGEGNSINMITR